MSTYGVGMNSSLHPANSGAAAVGSVAAGALNIMAPGAGTALSSVLGIQSNFESLFQQQIALQQVTTEQQMRSNMEKTRHESQMTAVRNMKA